MKLTKKNVARLASISALGAGALGVGAGSAEAGPITYTPLNGQVGVGPGFKSTFSASSFKAPIVPGIDIYFRRQIFTASSAFATGLIRMDAGLSVNRVSQGADLAFQLRNAVAGQKVTSLRSSTLNRSLLLGIRTLSGGVAGNGQNGTFYKLFAFVTSSFAPVDYGWIKLHETLSPTTGPDVQILGLAYDQTGSTIAAGDTGASSAPATPEPSSAALASLSALALGAAGLRRWRAVRNRA